MIMAAKALLDRNPEPSREEIATALCGNLCRCTGYTPILDAIEAAAEQIRNLVERETARLAYTSIAYVVLGRRSSNTKQGRL